LPFLLQTASHKRPVISSVSRLSRCFLLLSGFALQHDRVCADEGYEADPAEAHQATRRRNRDIIQYRPVPQSQFIPRASSLVLLGLWCVFIQASNRPMRIPGLCCLNQAITFLISSPRMATSIDLPVLACKTRKWSYPNRWCDKRERLGCAQKTV